MKSTYFHRVEAITPTKFWINNVTREEAVLAISEGAVGCTQNPSYTWKMISHETEGCYTLELMDKFIAEESDDNEVQVKLQRALVGNVANASFMRLYESSFGKYGYVSIQGDPYHEDVDTIIKYAMFNREVAPNIMAKIPVTPDGIKAIEYLASKCVPINATEVMSVRQAIDACAAYKKGISGIASPAPMFYSHISGILDEYLLKTVVKEGIDVNRDALWHAGIAAAKKTYRITKDIYPECGFIGGGARGLHHFTEMVGADAVVTINWKGTAENLIQQDPPVVSRFFMPTPSAIIDELITKVPDFKKAYMLNAITSEEYENFGPVVLFRNSFETAWKKANEFIAKRRLELSS